MALTLNIPKVIDKPIMVAESRPQKILQTLIDANQQSPLELAAFITGELEMLNRQKMPASTRVQALETYRPHLIKNIEVLASFYEDATLPLDDEAKLTAKAVELLWLELGYGYKIALIDLQHQLIKLGSEKTTVLVIARAMHAIAEQAMLYYQTYFVVPQQVWGDLHQLYFCAVQMGLQHTKTEPNALNGASPAATIENTYKYALLMFLADPQHLTQEDMRLIANYLAYHADLAQITAIPPENDDKATFIISLNANGPPVPCIKKQKNFNQNTDIILNTIDLVRMIHQQLGFLKAQKLPRDGSIPENANIPDYIDLLTYLIKHWGITPKRIFNRSPENGEIELVTGITAIHYVSSNLPLAKNISAITSNNDDGELVKKVMPSRWQILNISATGMAVRRHPTADKNIKVDQLVGIKTKNSEHWSLAIVRWANCESNDRLEIGIQLIAPSAKSVMAQINGRHSQERVLLLPEISAVNQVESLLAPRGTFAPASQMVLTHADSDTHIMLTKMIDRSHHFERIQFSKIN